MSALKSVMTIVKVMRILSLIAAICCFIGAVFALLGASLVFMLPTLIDMSFIDDIIGDYAPGLNAFKIGMAAVCGALISGAQGVVMLFAHVYFKNVEEAGTPFTRDGARELCRLGILTVVIPAVTVLISGSICMVLGISEELSNVIELGIGLGMILLSRFFLYGAELEEKAKEKTE